MSAPNTKSSKTDRILKRQIEDSRKLDVLIEDGRLAVHQAETIKVLTVHCASLEDDNKRLRRYLGSVLFERRVKAANELLAARLVREPPLRPIPTLRIADTASAAHTHSGAPHDIPPGEYRCRRCELLKAAIEATGEGCVEDAGEAA